MNRAAEAALGWDAPLPGPSDPENIVPPAADPALGATPAVLAPPRGTAEVDLLGNTVVPVGADAVVTFGSVVVTFGGEVVTGAVGTVVVAFGTVVTCGTVVVILGTVVVTGSVVVTFGSVVVTGSVTEIVGSAVVMLSCGTAEWPRIGALAKTPRRRRAARPAARLTRSAYPYPPARNPDGRCLRSDSLRRSADPRQCLSPHPPESGVRAAANAQQLPWRDNRRDARTP